MTHVAWQGPPPTRALGAALAAAGIRVDRRDSTGDGPLVVHGPGSVRAPVPRRADDGWVWCTDRTISDERRGEAIARGAYDAIDLRAPDAAVQLAARIREMLAPPPRIPESITLVLRSAAARRVAQQVAHVAATSMSVLFTGETGTGKEVMARLAHEWSPRSRKAFIPINCAAIPNELMEAELFGYARGAFSGAVQRYEGQIAAAAGGTVFLDEIDDMPLETQVKLLRVLEDRVVSRLGENIWEEIDFRLVAATNRDLRALVEAGLFGGDLYERLAIVTIPLLPLRERLEDLPDLAAHFMARFAREQQRAAVTALRDDARRALEAYPWPGNIRELRNVLYEALVFKRAGAELILSDLPRRILQRGAAAAADPAVDRRAISIKIARGTMSLKDEVAELERLAIDEALARSDGNAAQAARLLGAVGRGVARDPGGTLRAMMRRLAKRPGADRGRGDSGEAPVPVSARRARRSTRRTARGVDRP